MADTATKLRTALERLLEADERSAQRLRVAMYILVKARYGKSNAKVISIKEMAAALAMQPSNVTTALKAVERMMNLWKSEPAEEDRREVSFYLVPMSTKRTRNTKTSN
jgi:DNA-binding MarR family transcriptional regulator